jgi:hypothetical protein
LCEGHEFPSHCNSSCLARIVGIVNSLCIVTCYYNPEAYRTKLYNYLLFADALRASGLELVTVECSMGQADFELPNGPGLVRLRGRDVMWQKERLLNVAIENVPARFTKIAWLDCDLLFTNDTWAEETSRLLDRYPILQPFETVVRLPRGATTDASGGERWRSFGAAYAQQPHALLTGDFVEHGPQVSPGPRAGRFLRPTDFTMGA